jgi:hypothetical protein
MLQESVERRTAVLQSRTAVASVIKELLGRREVAGRFFDHLQIEATLTFKAFAARLILPKYS